MNKWMNLNVWFLLWSSPAQLQSMHLSSGNVWNPCCKPQQRRSRRRASPSVAPACSRENATQGTPPQAPQTPRNPYPSLGLTLSQWIDEQMGVSSFSSAACIWVRIRTVAQCQVFVATCGDSCGWRKGPYVVVYTDDIMPWADLSARTYLVLPSGCASILAGALVQPDGRCHLSLDSNKWWRQTWQHIGRWNEHWWGY